MANPQDLDGFYAIYYHGTAGPGLAQLQLLDGRIIGSDVTGGLWDGEFAINGVEGVVSCKVSIRLPKGVALATTGEPPKGNETSDMPFKLPLDFATREFVTLDLPIGKVNVRFQKLR